MAKLGNFAIHSFQFLRACAIGLILAANAEAAISNISVSGNFSYSLTATTADIKVDRIDNTTTDIATFGSYISDGLALELWAFAAPYTGLGQVGYQIDGYKLASYPIGQLQVGYYFANVDTGPIPLTAPPPGTWFITAFVTQQVGTPIAADGNLPQAYKNFPPVTFATTALVDAAQANIPKSGLWWDPSQVGTGYSIDIQHGVAVVTMYSYQSDGAPQWYLSSGPLSDNGQSFSSTLNKYVGGQCVSCTANRSPSQSGNDGSITINFTSATSATVYLPGGRVSQIVPAQF